MDIELVRKLKVALNYTEQGSVEYIDAAKELKKELTLHIPQLEQLIKHGPVYDGDVISKSMRDDLINIGLAVRVCCKGMQGYAAANYIGWNVFNADTY